MNTTKLKTYAPAARTAFIEAVTRRAGVLGIRPGKVDEVTEAGDVALIGGQPFPRSAVPLRKKLLERIKADGFAQVMEAMAYTWFNRFVALRFMELHGYFDHGYRVLSDPDGGSAPEILQKAEHVTLSGLDREEVIRLKLAGNQDEELYRLLLLAQCEELSRVLPDIFSLLDDATILLLPDNLLHSDSLIRQLVSGSDEADWEQVEVLGWLYQFYISERKDQVMARKSAVPTEDIPAVTQLFTPHWIVRYLVENSLGRLWLLNRPGSKLREKMPYYIEESGAGILPAIDQQTGKMPAPHSKEFRPFNPWEDIETTRRRLPHWQQEGASYFITFRLGDSIPREKQALWETERDQWLATHPQPWDEIEIAEYSRIFSERRQQWLDSGYGRCLLKIPSIAAIVQSALRHFEGERYLLDAFVLMPNHVHILVKPLPGYDLSSILHSWKSFTANQINKAIEAAGPVWQDESYDHVVRSESQLEFYRNYIRENPAKAGLKDIKAQSGAGVPPAIENQADKMPPHSESGAGVPPAMVLKEAGKMPALLSFLKITKPEDIRLCDPAVGSGHMLTYAFDLLYLIYEEEGYAPGDIPALILRHNVCGLEICPRAAQLAEMALVFKAREKSRRFFEKENFIRPNIIELRDVHFAEGELADYFKAIGIDPSSFIPHNSSFLPLLHQFEEAKNFGSLIQPCLSESEIQSARSALHNSSFIIHNSEGQLFLRETHSKVLRVLEQAEALTQRYHVVVANPPYMGSKFHNRGLKDFLEKTFPDEQQDTYTCFISRSHQLVKDGGTFALITLPSWMALPTFSDFRASVLRTSTLLGLNDNGRGVWGPDFGSCAFVFLRSHLPRYPTKFARLYTRRGEVNRNEEIEQSFLEKRWIEIAKEELAQIPGTPLAYWTSPAVRQAFTTYPAVSTTGEAKNGMTTGENEKFLRFWFEVAERRLAFDRQPGVLPPDANSPWVPYSKGGEFRKWYGNTELILNWGRDGELLRANRPKTILRNPQFYFREAITWSLTSMLGFGARHRNAGFTFDVNGMSLFVDASRHAYVLAFLNSRVAREFLEILNPTIAFQAGDIGRLPLLENVSGVIANANSCRQAATQDWDNFETSWDFRDQPLLRPGLKGATLEASWRNWEAQSTAAIRRMQELETENNRLFIAAYGLDGELQPEVPEAQITLARADAKRDMSAFLSYAVGCMMGRFSLFAPGLILADAGATVEDYWKKVGQASCLPGFSNAGKMPAPHSESGAGVPPAMENKTDKMPAPHFLPDADGILPILDGEWFDDDIVTRTRDFLRTTFGEATLNENLEFLKKSLGKDLRTYFLSDFGKDHLQTYKNRPIYWLFSSGKEKAFQCLVYLHRYHSGTLARMRTEYVIPLQGKLNARIAHLEEEKAHTTTSAQGKKLQTEQDKLKKQQAELIKFDEQLRHYADQKITLDLDDGVKVNYAKFGPLLAEAKKVCGKKEEE
jgi:REP element-mobilizing transposase RayT